MAFHIRKFRHVLLVVAFGVACDTPQPAAEPAQSADAQLVLAAAMAAMPPQGTSLDAMPDPTSDGAQLVAQYCSACHAMPHPTSHSATDWPVVMRRMWLRMEIVARDFQVPVPDAAQRMTMTRYMLSNALVVSDTDLPNIRGRDSFERQCARCHALPDPRQHTPSDWATVVTRMSTHMEELLNDILTHDQIQELVLYLEQASARLP